jgi:hypothetical protein
MFKRVSTVFALIFLFAFAQIGAITHEISHYSDYSQHSQQDKNTNHSQCAQCISYAEVAGGLPTQVFIFVSDDARFFTRSDYHQNFQSHLSTHYSARAPPQIA